ncbi:MAG: hypothetical protein WCC17_24385, partial [Candidatus Nitrosopolaris sp.]
FFISQNRFQLMYRENIGSVVILTKNAGSHDSKRDEVTPVGIITERSIVRMIGFSANLFPDMNVSEIVSTPLITVSTTTSVKDAVDFDG